MQRFTSSVAALVSSEQTPESMPDPGVLRFKCLPRQGIPGHVTSRNDYDPLPVVDVIGTEASNNVRHTRGEGEARRPLGTAALGRRMIVTGMAGNGASERQLIEHVLAVTKDRLSAAQNPDIHSRQNSDFTSRRFEELHEQLELAHKTIAELTELLYGESNSTPASLTSALRSHSESLQPVHLDIEGTPHTFMVSPQGRDDPAAAIRLWRKIQKRHGEGGA